ncbi:mucin-19-like isoform X2 [Achroia grisella]|uniref:mucin-19-like isoform X2 n=1 Tax=Achroia grisella TaxID=688607 RepID=UPI0027D32905|nr:mucin-19-like isoform X2 [Achroia grisella]
MELVCAIVLTFVTVVSGVPHGYGALEGAGAAAKEAHAAAGAFSGLGGLPISIPNGAGFSGSFSKSSSSSFASSSASASSGAFSFSGSSTGNLNRVGANNFGTSSNGGCASGGCKYGPEGVNDNSQSYNIASAGAASQAGAVTGFSDNSKINNQRPCAGDCSNLKPSDCKGSGCNDFSGPSSNCALGGCGGDFPLDTSSHNNGPSNSVIGTSHANDNTNCVNGKCGINVEIDSKPELEFNVNKCTSGKCGPKTETTLSSSTPILETVSSTGNDGSNDILVGTTGPLSPKLQPESSYQSPIYGETAISTSIPISKPTSNTVPSSPTQNKYPTASESPTSSSYTIPAGHLLTPKLEPACTSPNCQPENSKPGYNYLTPTSSGSDKPINHVYPNNLLKETNSPTTFSNNSPYTNNIGLKGPTSCVSGNCGNYPPGRPTGISDSETQAPKDSLNANHRIPSVIPSYIQNGPESCSSGNCGTQPKPENIPSNPFIQPTENSPSGSKYPAVTCGSGNCGNYPHSTPSYFQGISPSNPQNCISGKCSSYPSPISTEYKIPAQNYNNPAGPANCISGNCNSYPSTQYSEYPNNNQGNFPNAPVNCASGKCNNPSNTGSEIIPTPTQNCISGKCQTIPSKTNVDSNIQGFSNPLSSLGPLTTIPANCASGNCGNSPIPTINTGNKIPYFDRTLPGNVENCASGNCGSNPPNTGFSQSLPNNVSSNDSQESFPAFVPLQPNQSPQYNNPSNKPTYGLHSNNGASPNNDVSSISHSISPNLNLNETIPSSQKGPAYTGGFGGPPGLLKPNNFDLPLPGGFVPTPVDNTNKPESVSNKPASCSSSGSCITQSNLGGSTNNNISPEHSISTPSHYDQGHHSTGINSAAAATANAVAYSGGFGGPPGFLKPYDDGKIGDGSVTKPQFGTNNKETLSSYDNKINGASGLSHGFITQAGSFAGASAGSFGNSNNNKENHGCRGGCDSTGSGGYTSNLGFNGNSGFGLSKYGLSEGLHGISNTAAAASKSAAGVLSGANAGSFGTAGSFASSSASAHASSGFATKGGYGR